MRQASRSAWAMMAPALLCLSIFVALPLALSVVFSMTDLRLGSPLATRFVGLSQYRRLLTDPMLMKALCNNLTFVAVVVPAQTGLALLAALMLNQKLAGMTIFRTLIFLPVVFPMSLVAVIWEMIFAPGPGGPLNSALMFLSAGTWQPRDFLHDPNLALPALIALSMWQGVGLQMVILLAGLQSLPKSLVEAARLDGAGGWAVIRHVTLPHLRNPLIFTGMMTTILAFRVFDQVQILTEGGPVGATTTLIFEVVGMAFERLQIARASALGVLFFTIVLSLSLLQRWLAREDLT